MDVFDLVAKISIDKTGYDKGLEEASNSTKSFGSKIGSGLKTVGTAAAGAAAAGAAAATAGVVALTKSAVDGYAETEQLVGGVQKLYGKAADTVVKNAKQAYQTAGMSQSEYLDTATQFSASLVSSLGGNVQKAADQTDVAMKAISDNVNVFGSNIDDVTNAFKGFSKQNYTMLDNLKLGYGGTQKEMQRLIDDANKWGKANGEASNLSINSFSDVVTAIEQIQEKQKIAGTTSKEAATTVEGSINMTKKAWENLISGLADPDADIPSLIDNLVDSATHAAENLEPVIERALQGIVTAVDKLAPVIADKLPALMEKLTPPLISAVGTLIAGLIKALPGLIDAIAQALPGMLQTIWSAISEQLTSITPLFQPVLDAIQLLIVNFEALSPVIAGVVGAFAMFKTITTISGIINTVTTALTAFKTAQEASTVAQAALNMVMSANPFLLVATLIAGVVAALVMLYNTNDTVRAAIDSAWSSIQQIFMTAVSTVGTAIQSIITFLAQLPTSIDQILATAVQSVVAWGTQMVITAITAARGFTTGLITSLISLPGQVMKVLMAIITSATSFVVGMRSKAIEAGQSFFTGLWNTISQIPGKMVGIGKAIVSGVWNGFNSMASSFASHVYNFFSGLVSKVKGALGIHSPSKVFAGIGQNMVLGMGEGWSTSIDGVQRDISNSIDTTNDLASSEIGVGMPGTSGTAVGTDLTPIITLLQSYLPQIANMQVVMDGGALVGQLAPGMNAQLGIYSRREGR